MPLSIEGRSVGVACGVVKVEPEADLDELIDRADREMYKDKRIKKSMSTSGKAA
jgi:PleD family two-component response regulator